MVFDATNEEPLLEIAVENALGILDRKSHAGLIEKKRNIDKEFDNLYQLHMRGKNLLKEQDFAKMEILKDQSLKLDIEISNHNTKTHKSQQILSKRRKSDFKQLGAIGLLHSFGYADKELEEATDKQIKALLENPFLMRLALKNSGYSILVRRDHNPSNKNRSVVLETNAERFKEHSWKILRRSQKLGAYIIEHTWAEEDYESSEKMNACLFTKRSEILEAKRKQPNSTC